MPYRIGHGFDVHRFRRGRKLILGGIRIPYISGLAGHSDADVLLHSLMNALLGAIGQGDIGTHFPDSDPRYKDISSEKLLRRVLRMVKAKKCRVVNVDITVLAQRPRLAPFFKNIRPRLAEIVGVKPDCVNIKASTTEKLGWVGDGRGIAAMAVVLLRKA